MIRRTVGGDFYNSLAMYVTWSYRPFEENFNLLILMDVRTPTFEILNLFGCIPVLYNFIFPL